MSDSQKYGRSHSGLDHSIDMAVNRDVRTAEDPPSHHHAHAKAVLNMCMAAAESNLALTQTPVHVIARPATGRGQLLRTPGRLGHARPTAEKLDPIRRALLCRALQLGWFADAGQRPFPDGKR